MNRKETTNFLSELLISQRLADRKYYAREVSIDYGSRDVKRIDFLQFEPSGVMNVAEIEKGVFTCYEIKSCVEDFNSGFGKNFIGEKNYFIMPMDTYRRVCQKIPHNVGCMVPVPGGRGKHEEFENPTPLSLDSEWKLEIIRNSVKGIRKKSMIEMLFCMVRSGK